MIRLRAPVSVFLNVTNRCNLECVYCSADAGIEPGDELTGREMRDLVEALIRARVCHVIITGGEPFVRPDLADTLERLSRAGVTLSINTNGTLLTPTRCASLRGLGICRVAVSVDGPGEETNAATRGYGSFSRALRGVRNLQAAGINPTVSVTVTRANILCLEEVVHKCMEWGVAGVSMTHLSRQGRAAKSDQTVWPSYEEWGLATEVVGRLRFSHAGFVSSSFSHWMRYRADANGGTVERASVPAVGHERCFLRCDAGKASCAITAHGWVVPCNRFEAWRCGNIRETGFSRAWLGERMEAIRELADRPVSSGSICSKCIYNRRCSGGCRADAFGAFGTLDAPDPHCRIIGDSAVSALCRDVRELGMCNGNDV